MSTKEELKELIHKYHHAIHYTDYAEQNESTQIALNAFLEENSLYQEILAKIDELMDADDLKAWGNSQNQEILAKIDELMDADDLKAWGNSQSN